MRLVPLCTVGNYSYAVGTNDLIKMFSHNCEWSTVGRGENYVFHLPQGFSPRAPLSLTPTSFPKRKRPLRGIGFFSLCELSVNFMRLLLFDTRSRTIENPPVCFNCSDRRLRFERPINFNVRSQKAKTLTPHEVSERSNAMLRVFP